MDASRRTSGLARLPLEKGHRRDKDLVTGIERVKEAQELCPLAQDECPIKSKTKDEMKDQVENSVSCIAETGVVKANNTRMLPGMLKSATAVAKRRNVKRLITISAKLNIIGSRAIINERSSFKHPQSRRNYTL